MTVQYMPPTKRERISQKEAARLFLINNGMCCNCGQQITSAESWFIEHVDALVLGGAETDDNRRPSHVKNCKARKDAADAGARSKRDRTITKHLDRGERPSFSTNRNGPLKKRMDGTVVVRSTGALARPSKQIDESYESEKR